MIKSKPHLDLPEDRLASTTQTGHRVKLYPADVTGYFRRLRTWVYGFLVLLFLGLPWLRIHGKPVLLMDVVHLQFTVFGFSFQADDVPVLFLGLAIWGFLIAMVTALWGRVWCGWACPQTVFIDVIYRRIERWIEGNAHSQKLLDKAPWTTTKILKKVLKTLLFLIVSWLISHSFLAYFVGSDMVMTMVRSNPLENPVSAALTLLLTLLLTLIIWFDFGVFREQFCIIACPYGRFQSVLMDRDSRGVMYDTVRGEPRSKSSKTGACIDCFRCVQVCPTGVDIRRGLQMECIHCTACIDACDTVMTKIGAPKGLLRYGSQVELEGGKRSRIRPMVYGVILFGLVSAMGLVLHMRQPLRATVVRGHQSFSVMADTDVLNMFTVHLYNRRSESVSVNLESGDTRVQILSPVTQTLPPFGRVSVPVVLHFSQNYLQGKPAFVLRVMQAQESLLEIPVPLLGPL